VEKGANDARAVRGYREIFSRFDNSLRIASRSLTGNIGTDIALVMFIGWLSDPSWQISHLSSYPQDIKTRNLSYSQATFNLEYLAAEGRRDRAHLLNWLSSTFYQVFLVLNLIFVKITNSFPPNMWCPRTAGEQLPQPLNRYRSYSSRALPSSTDSSCGTIYMQQRRTRIQGKNICMRCSTSVGHLLLFLVYLFGY
jgi:hypothetical protein